MAVNIPPWVNTTYETLYFIVGVFLFVPKVYVPWLCIILGTVGLMVEKYYFPAPNLKAIISFIVPFWHMLTSCALLAAHMKTYVC